MRLPGCARGRRGQGVQSPPSWRGSCCPAASKFRACGTVGLRISLYSPVYFLKISRKPRKKALFTIYITQETYNNASFSYVMCSKPGPKQKQNIGILCLFSTTCETQYLIIDGCWSSSTVDLVCFLQRLELFRVTFHFGTQPKDTKLCNSVSSK